MSPRTLHLGAETSLLAGSQPSQELGVHPGGGGLLRLLGW